MNISDIAKLAGVSPSTVSRYLNNGYVSKEKREIIAKVIQETGYAPLSAAQNLKTQKTRTIGVIVPRIASESVSHMVDGITKRFNNTGYEILLGNTNNNIEKEIDYLSYFEKNAVDGVIFLATELDKKEREILKRYNKPIVIASQNIEGFACVYNDDQGAAYLATKHLIDMGCNNIVYLGVLEEDIAAGHNRYQGFLKALEDNGLKAAAEKRIDFSSQESYSVVNELINSDIEFDGVFCATDNIAAGAIGSLFRSGKIIPKDVKVIGIGDNTLSRFFVPSISSIHLYYDELGYEAADMIIDFINGNAKTNRKVQLGYELVQRESTKNEQA